MGFHPHMEQSLIEKVKEHEILYNRKYPDYHNFVERHKAWKKIGKDLKVPADDCKKYWDKLRCCFRNASRRHPRIWKYSRQMSFLEPFLKKSSGRAPRDANKSQASVTSEIQSDNQSEESEAEETTPVESDGEYLQEVIEALAENSALVRREYEERNTQPKSLLETLDEMDMFFLSMSRMTRQMPKSEQIRIQLGLTNSVLSAKQRCNVSEDNVTIL